MTWQIMSATLLREVGYSKFKISTLNAWENRIDQPICEEMCASNSMVVFQGTRISSLVIMCFKFYKNQLAFIMLLLIQ